MAAAVPGRAPGPSRAGVPGIPGSQGRSGVIRGESRWRDHRGVFDEFPEFGTEAGGGRSVNHVCVDYQGQVQDVPDLDLAVDHSRPLSHPADDHLQ